MYMHSIEQLGQNISKAFWTCHLSFLNLKFWMQEKALYPTPPVMLLFYTFSLSRRIKKAIVSRIVSLEITTIT